MLEAFKRNSDNPPPADILPFLCFAGATLTAKDEVHSLGIIPDPVLSVDIHIASVVPSAFFHFRWIAQLSLHLDTRSPTMLVHTLVQWCLALRLPRIMMKLHYDDLFAITIALAKRWSKLVFFALR